MPHRDLGFGPVDEDLLQASVEFSSFDHMKDMERQGSVGRRLLSPGDVQDPESFKVRRGVVGGHADYLDDDDLGFIERAAAGLRL